MTTVTTHRKVWEEASIKILVRINEKSQRANEKCVDIQGKKRLR